MSKFQPDYEAVTTPCREWQGARTAAGYGVRRINGKNRYVHRWVYSRLHGGFRGISGKLVMHLCDNPPCFRYDHLRLGTTADNAADMVAKGRGVHKEMRGENNPMTFLRERDVRAIRAAVATGEKQTSVARRFGVSRWQVSHIIRRTSWAWLED